MAILRPQCSQLEKSGSACVIDMRADTLLIVRGFSENKALQKCGSCAYFAIKSPKSVAGWNFLVIVLGNPGLAAGCTFPVTFSLGILQLHCCSHGCNWQDLGCIFPAWIIWMMLLQGALELSWSRLFCGSFQMSFLYSLWRRIWLMEKGLSLDTLFSKPNSQALVLCFLFVEKKKSVIHYLYWWHVCVHAIRIN